MQLTRETLEKLFDADARINTIIHIQAACIDEESPAEAMAQFIEDDAFEVATVSRLTESWPEYQELVDGLQKDFEEQKKWDTSRNSLRMLHSETAGVFLRRCPMALLVQIQYQIKKYHRADPKGVGLGSYSSGWGYYSVRWVLVDTIDEAIQLAIDMGNEATRSSWQAAIEAANTSKTVAVSPKKPCKAATP